MTASAATKAKRCVEEGSSAKYGHIVIKLK